MTLNEKAAYLQGLSEGLTYDKTSAEGKLLTALIDLTSELAKEVTRLSEDAEYLNDYCEELDEDLGDVEEVLLGDDEDEEDDEEELEDEEFYEMECPFCGETIEFDASIDPENLTCPACHKAISLKLEDLEAADGVEE